MVPKAEASVTSLSNPSEHVQCCAQGLTHVSVEPRGWHSACITAKFPTPQAAASTLLSWAQTLEELEKRSKSPDIRSGAHAGPRSTHRVGRRATTHVAHTHASSGNSSSSIRNGGGDAPTASGRRENSSDGGGAGLTGWIGRRGGNNESVGSSSSQGRVVARRGTNMGADNGSSSSSDSDGDGGAHVIAAHFHRQAISLDGRPLAAIGRAGVRVGVPVGSAGNGAGPSSSSGGTAVIPEVPVDAFGVVISAGSSSSSSGAGGSTNSSSSGSGGNSIGDTTAAGHDVLGEPSPPAAAASAAAAEDGLGRPSGNGSSDEEETPATAVVAEPTTTSGVEALRHSYVARSFTSTDGRPARDSSGATGRPCGWLDVDANSAWAASVGVFANHPDRGGFVVGLPSCLMFDMPQGLRRTKVAEQLVLRSLIRQVQLGGPLLRGEEGFRGAIAER